MPIRGSNEKPEGRSWLRVALLAGGVAVLLFLLVVSLVGEEHPIDNGVPAPQIAAVDLDGQRVDVGMFSRGLPRVVNIWATWCPPCMRELPEFAAEARMLTGHVQFLGLAADSPPDDTRAVAVKLAIPYPIVRIDEVTQRHWNADALPSTYLVDATGVVRWSVRGAIDTITLRKALKESLGIDADAIAAAPREVAAAPRRQRTDAAARGSALDEATAR